MSLSEMGSPLDFCQEILEQSPPSMQDGRTSRQSSSVSQEIESKSAGEEQREEQEQSHEKKHPEAANIYSDKTCDYAAGFHFTNGSCDGLSDFFSQLATEERKRADVFFKWLYENRNSLPSDHRISREISQSPLKDEDMDLSEDISSDGEDSVPAEEGHVNQKGLIRDFSHE